MFHTLMKPLRIDHFLALKLPGHFEGFNWVSKGLQALSEESVRVHFLAQFHGISNGHLREYRFNPSSKVSVRVRFPAQAWAIVNRDLRPGCQCLSVCLCLSASAVTFVNGVFAWTPTRRAPTLQARVVVHNLPLDADAN